MKREFRAVSLECHPDKITEIAGSLTELGEKVLESFGLISVSLASVMQNITNSAINFLLALLLSVYVLYGKENFVRQIKKILYWILPESQGGFNAADSA